MPSLSRRPSATVLVPVIGLVVVLTVVAGLLTKNLYHRSAGAPTVQQTEVTSPPSSLPASAQPGPTTVQLLPDAASYPLAQTVQQLMQTYFDAINSQNYNAWTTVVTTPLITANKLPQWKQEFGTTKDGSVLVYRIEAATGGTLRVLFTFTSTQSVASAPPSAPWSCINWQEVWSLVNQNGTWLLAAGSVQAKECSSDN